MAGWLLGSIVALMTGERQAALALIETRLRAHPTDSQCLLQKAECLLALGERSAALDAAEAAAVNARGAAPSLEAVADFLVEAGEQARAVPLYADALARTSNDRILRANLLAKRAAAHRFVGALELAERDYEAVLAIDAVAPTALKGLTELRRQTRERNWIPQMEQALRRLPADSSHAAILHFGLAKSFHDLGEHGRSWEHLSAANRIERSLINYDPADDRALMRAMEEVFATPEAAAVGAAQESPIFIIGLPRSGTTLVERILSNRPDVHACGEVTAMTDAILSLGDRGAGDAPIDARAGARRLFAIDGPTLASEYLQRTRFFRREGKRWTDKHLVNHLYCPLLLRAFPNARIMQVKRHPLAVCYAMYRTRFRGSYPFAYDLTEIAEFIIGYERLMAHWHRVLPGRILDVSYEQLVTDFEPSVRRLLAYAGLPFDAACLEFHRNPAPVITASSVQVRQPLYDSSVHEWRQYADGLAPARSRLEAAGIPLE